MEGRKGRGSSALNARRISAIDVPAVFRLRRRLLLVGLPHAADSRALQELAKRLAWVQGMAAGQSGQDPGTQRLGSTSIAKDATGAIKRRRRSWRSSLGCGSVEWRPAG